MDVPVGGEPASTPIKTWVVYPERADKAPVVIVIHEIPGLHPGVLTFAHRVIEAGFTTYLPSLFGTPGRPPSGGYIMSTLARACVSREFTVFADRTSRV